MQFSCIDTNAKRLFYNNTRAFSCSCIRMEKAVALAQYLVSSDVATKSKYVNLSLKEESQHIMMLQHPIPIYIRYYICDVANDQLNFYGDIYKRDPFLNGSSLQGIWRE
jgi:L,D-transpeptidase YcbB